MADTQKSINAWKFPVEFPAHSKSKAFCLFSGLYHFITKMADKQKFKEFLVSTLKN